MIFCNGLLIGYRKITTYCQHPTDPLFAFWSHFSCEELGQLKLGQNRFFQHGVRFFVKKFSDEPFRAPENENFPQKIETPQS